MIPTNKWEARTGMSSWWKNETPQTNPSLMMKKKKSKIYMAQLAMCSAFVSLQHLVTCFKCLNRYRPKPCTTVEKEATFHSKPQSYALHNALVHMETCVASNPRWEGGGGLPHPLNTLTACLSCIQDVTDTHAPAFFWTSCARTGAHLLEGHPSTTTIDNNLTI